VSLELREFEPVEKEQRKLDFVRPRLILQADEDCWKVLPGKGAPKRLRTIPAPHLAHMNGTGRRCLPWTASSACAAAVVD
jgi:hypothetical protein